MTILATLNYAPWDWYELLSPIFVQLPLISACFVGLFLTWRYRESAPKAAQLTAVSLILLLIHLTAGTYLSQQLPYYLYNSGLDINQMGNRLTLFNFLQSTLLAVAILLLLAAVFRWRKEAQ